MKCNIGWSICVIHLTYQFSHTLEVIDFTGLIAMDRRI